MTSIDHQPLIDHYSGLLQKLKSIEEENGEEDASSKLDEYKRELCGVDKNDHETAVDKLQNDLETSESMELTDKIAKLVAELGKEEKCRNLLTRRNFFKQLNKHLCDSFDAKYENITNTNLLKTQICRAFGNLCYYNDNGRLEFLKTCGLKSVLDLCTYVNGLLAKSDQANLPPAQMDELNTLVSVLLGCMHNLTNENEVLRKAFYEQDIFKVVKQFIPYLKNSAGILVHWVSLVENLTELAEGKTLFVKEKLALELYKNLDEKFLYSLDDYSEDFFSFLSVMNEFDESVDFLCESKFLNLIMNVIEKNLSKTELIRHIGLFLVNLLVQDAQINLVFDYDNGLLINKAIEWLDKYDNEQLYVTSAVILANYMRNDEKVAKMINNQQQPHAKIINILKKYNKLGATAGLQQINVAHSLLGALRNFCVAVSTREELLKHDVIETVMEFLDYENFEIIFKSLAIVRLLAKSCGPKTGVHVIFSDQGLNRLKNLLTHEHVGIHGELTRLVCYLPIVATKSSPSDNYTAKFIQWKFVPVVSDQLACEHLIMLNEALIALNVLVTIDYRNSYEQLKESSLNTNMKALIEKKKLPADILFNLTKLFKFLFERNDFFDENDLNDYKSKLTGLKLEMDVEPIKSHLSQLISLIDNVL